MNNRSWTTTLPEFGTIALSIMQPRALQIEGTEIDEHGIFVMSPDLQPALSPFRRNRSLLLSTTRWAEHKLGTKRSGSRIAKKVTTYLQTMLRKRKTTKFPLETEARAAAYDMTNRCHGSDSARHVFGSEKNGEDFNQQTC